MFYIYFTYSTVVLAGCYSFFISKGMLMLNKQGSGKIDWTDFSWNPIGGCLHDCSYCYLKRKQQRFKSNILEPKFRPEYLRDFSKRRKPLPDGTKIFVGSAADMWGNWVKHDWIYEVLAVVKENPQYVFQFLTKNPEKYDDFDLPKNGWYGTTVDGTEKTKYNLWELIFNVLDDRVRFVSFEPLLAPVDVDLSCLDWIIIGADSNRGAKKPPKEWADKLIEQARELNVAVWVKDNYGYDKRIKQWPMI